MRLAGLVLLVLGVLALVYGGFSYRKEKGDARIGPIEIEVTEKERVNVPLWAGIAAVAVGGALVARRPRP
jgi:drug/metabolite transporter (DMT)-like permease